MNRLVARRAKIVLTVIAAASLLPLAALDDIVLDTDIRSMMPADHHVRVFAEWAEDYFSIEDPILLLISAEGPDGVFTPTILQLVERLSDEVMALEAIDGDDLVSLSQTDNIVADDDTLLVDPFFEKAPTTQAEADRVRAAVFANSMIVGSLVSNDGAATTIAAEVLGGYDRHDVFMQIQEVVGRHSDTDARIMIAGRPVVESELGRLAELDVERMFPIVVVTSFAVLWAVLGCLRGAFLPAAVVVLSVVWTAGTAVRLGVPFQPMITLMPTLIVAIGVADGIHVIHYYLLGVATRPDMEASDIVIDTMDELWAPLTLTSITTAAGFLALAASPITSVTWLGILTACGAMFALFFSLTLLPAALVVLPRPDRAAQRLGKAETTPGRPLARAIAAVERLVTERPTAALAGCVLLAAVCLGRLGQLTVDGSMLANFPDGNPVKVADAEYISRFGGTNPMNVVLTAPDRDDWKSPERLRAVAALQAFIESRGHAGKTRSVADYVKRMNQVMNGNDPAHYVIPDDRELIAQYLLLYSISGDPGDMDDVIDYDYRIANIRANLDSDHSPIIASELGALSRFGHALFEPLAVDLQITGNARINMAFMNMIINGQLGSLAIAVAIVALVTGLVFRSVVGGLLTCLPVALATLLNFGWLPWIGAPLGVATAMISSVGIGIGVDYAIHFVMRYRRDLQHGLDRRAAMHEALATSGVAIFFNALVVMIGFGALSLSQFPPNHAFGQLVALNMAICLLSTVTVLAALLYSFQPEFLTRE